MRKPEDDVVGSLSLGGGFESAMVASPNVDEE
jgi:hypothetical protein